MGLVTHQWCKCNALPSPLTGEGEGGGEQEDLFPPYIPSRQGRGSILYVIPVCKIENLLPGSGLGLEVF